VPAPAPRSGAVLIYTYGVIRQCNAWVPRAVLSCVSG